jgi:hypothetical protein
MILIGTDNFAAIYLAESLKECLQIGECNHRVDTY